ncbi:MAG: hypothetical protein QW838_02960 [Candidatus Nitrosotenuis sp.]
MKENTHRWLLNSAVLPNFGTYLYYPPCSSLAPERHINGNPCLDCVKAAADWLHEEAWESTIRYKETAEALRILTGVHVPLSPKAIKMNVGDVALVFRLRYEEGASRIPEAQKGKLTPLDVLSSCELGFLERVE